MSGLDASGGGAGCRSVGLWRRRAPNETMEGRQRGWVNNSPEDTPPACWQAYTGPGQLSQRLVKPLAEPTGVEEHGHASSRVHLDVSREAAISIQAPCK